MIRNKWLYLTGFRFEALHVSIALNILTVGVEEKIVERLEELVWML